MHLVSPSDLAALRQTLDKAWFVQPFAAHTFTFGTLYFSMPCAIAHIAPSQQGQQVKQLSGRQ
jgi:hypothetical protein